MTVNNHTLLIVDDVAINLDILRSLLVDKYNVKVAKNGPAALKIAQNSSPDLILLDIMMPGLDGFQVCKQLKSDPKTRDIPIIFLTARTETKDIVAGFEAGGIDYLTKPFNPHELLARVNTQILIKEQRDLIIKRSNEQKEMLHILSHDLGNHFAVIMFALELLKMNAHKADEYLQRIKHATRQGIDVINLVREMRMSEDKTITLEPLNLNKIIGESLLVLGDRFEQKQVCLNINVADDITILAEKRSLVNSVINNLLTNALKFSFENSRVEISATERNGIIEFCVEDHGIGMPGAHLENIFNLSKSISRTGTSGEEGTGFGMSLIKSFVESYGGSITVESRDIQQYPQNHGTKVTINFRKSLQP
ncbi:MAG TPA: hybrid sensor histidine kinase/response regulator [Candidatus Marinimicrobia bacterium]|nr:hybrid sensor histidine kinase/response regulator [Candidatus Neomarinimicrobiota bacterium]